ncbi:MAG TPA: hypothetical protein VLK26_04565 [Rudaea sp.]|nr:hypothetical protein [Rudaea sp.]
MAAAIGAGLQTINVGSQLPPIGEPVIIDGLTQPGANCAAWPPTLAIQISSPTNGQYNGFTLNPGSDGSTIRGLVINGFNNNQGYAYNQRQPHLRQLHRYRRHRQRGDG